MKKLIRRTETLQSQVYEYLRDKILIGGLAPGQRLIEERIVEETGVSRSPIREAIRRLEKDGLVVVQQQGGVTVYAPKWEDFSYLYECRLNLEPAAAMYAAERRSQAQVERLQELLEMTRNPAHQSDPIKIHELNFEIHHLISEASANPYLVKMLKDLKVLISFYRNVIIRTQEKRPETVVDEHAAILQAIADQDGQRAKQLMEEHIRTDYRLYLESYQESNTQGDHYAEEETTGRT
ncbi:GntR family transcriptional regulator [Brevibacillus massiliensis]|uniref:GntR family transcriptional regulator n=1 Tax=Brevibacillus massiliensis TaxID=1118054 RepID=UPI0002D8E71B|nr:GntR family transcriptional regulator [Brevibacillus massiliensis]